MNEYQRLFQKTQGLRNLIILFSFLIFIGAALLAVGLSWKFYSPIGGLVKMMKNETGDTDNTSPRKNLDELEYISKTYLSIMKDSKSLKQQHRDNWMFLKKEFLKNLLNGQTYFYKNLEKKFEEMMVNLELHHFTVVILRIDDYWRIFSRADNEEDASLMVFAIINITQEILSEKYKNEAVELGNDKIAIILNTNDETTEKVHTNISGLIKQAQEAAGEHLKIKMSAGIGPCVAELHDINQTFKTALEISDYRLIFGKQCIILPSMVEQNINMDYSYSEDIQREILDKIRLKNYAGINDKINKFFCMLRSLSFSDIVMSLQRLIYASIRTINETSREKNYKYSYNVLQNEFCDMDTLEEIREWMLDLFKQVIEDMNGSQHTGYQAVKTNHVDKTVDIINEEFNNPNLTPEELASRLNLSVNYLRDIFKELKGVSLSNYINEYKFEKAKELLLNTDIPVSEISEKVGFVNQNYFFTFFKKYSGFTPTQFRNKGKTTFPEESNL